MNKLKNKKAAQSKKMTADWINSMPPITISDDSDDDDDDDAPDNQPNDSTGLAAESAHRNADQPSTVVSENSAASKPFSTEVSIVKTSDTEIYAVDSANAVVTKTSVDTSVYTVTRSVETLPDETVDSTCPAQVPSAELKCTSTVVDAEKPATEFMDVDDKLSGGKVTVAGSVDHHADSTSVTMAGIAESHVVVGQSSEMKTDKIECSSKEEEPVLSSGQFSFVYSFNCFATLCT